MSETARSSPTERSSDEQSTLDAPSTQGTQDKDERIAQPSMRHTQPAAYTLDMVGGPARAHTGTPARSAPQHDGRTPAAEGTGEAQSAAKPGAQARTGEQKPQIEVPERPKLAPGIKPVGEMQECAFKNPPWLIEREGGGYIQVTKLLYHVAEHCNGQHTLEDIARKVSEATGRKVSADNVRQLVGKPIPMGIVCKSDGSVEGGAERGKDRSISPLAVNMKMAMVPSAIVEPVAKAFTVFFWPPVVVLLVLVAFAIEGWLYLMHGVGKSFHDAFYTPGLLLAVLAIVIIATAHHEIGHAAALTYGGGKVGGMGAGIYIVYPAFYTDVTDNYRLPRWSRVRTDLGGIYFNLIFSIGLTLLWLVTGWEFLLLVILFINFEIIHNLMPFVRLDGYWTLADITGIPDFFSQMVPFLRSVLPDWVPFPEGRKLPELKTWAKWFFAIYILVTIPLLLFVLFLMVKGVPRILATVWDAFWKHAGELTGALGRGDVLNLLAIAVQMVLLALPAFALMFTLFNLGKRVVVAVWNWSKPTPARRIAGAFGSLAAVALLVWLWAPQLPFIGLGPGPLHGTINFEPIRPNERFALGDIISGQIVTRTDTLTNTGVLTGTATVTATMTATGGTPTIGGSGVPTATLTLAARSTTTALATMTTGAGGPFGTVTGTAMATAGAVSTASPAVPTSEVREGTTPAASPTYSSPSGATPASTSTPVGRGSGSPPATGTPAPAPGSTAQPTATTLVTPLATPSPAATATPTTTATATPYEQSTPESVSTGTPTP